MFDNEAIALLSRGYQIRIVVIMKYCFEAENLSSFQQNVEIDSSCNLQYRRDLHFECVGEVLPGGVQLGAKPPHGEDLEAGADPPDLRGLALSPHGLHQPPALTLHSLQLLSELLIVIPVSCRTLKLGKFNLHNHFLCLVLPPSCPR